LQLFPSLFVIIEINSFELCICIVGEPEAREEDDEEGAEDVVDTDEEDVEDMLPSVS
jgi:hypothetical protein